jgi:hypothetical protein
MLTVEFLRYTLPHPFGQLHRSKSSSSPVARRGRRRARRTGIEEVGSREDAPAPLALALALATAAVVACEDADEEGEDCALSRPEED